jgi:type VI secretion system secreted protein VgrG
VLFEARQCNQTTADTLTFYAKATDNTGLVRQSNSVSVVVSSTPAVYYIQADQIDTPRVVTDQANKVVWRWDGADPFGAGLPDEDPDGDGVRFTMNLRFPGQYFDRETGLHYNYFRDYDPAMGRYLQPEPLGLAGDINLYRYARNNPLSYIDPDGAQAFPILPPPVLAPAGPSPWPGGRSKANGTFGGLFPPGTFATGSSSVDDDAVVYDKAGQKVSPRAQCMAPPGDCGPGEQKRMQDEVDRACKRPRACRPGMDAIEILISREKNRECAMARDKLNKTCFAGGDSTHRDAANDAWGSVANCETMMH